jgi:hypothetical protein
VPAGGNDQDGGKDEVDDELVADYRQLARGTGSERRFDRAHHRPEGDKGVEREVCQQDEALPFRMRDRNGRRVCLAREEQSQARHHASENHQRGDRKQEIGSGGGEETHTCGPDN